MTLLLPYEYIITKFDGITFDGNVLFETGNINFYNCTFNKDIIINNRNIFFEGCTFNGKVTLNTSVNSQLINNTFKSANAIEILNSNNNLFENNTINTSTHNTIIFDDDSENNIIRNNYLMADSSFGDYSVISTNIILLKIIFPHITQKYLQILKI